MPRRTALARSVAIVAAVTLAALAAAAAVVARQEPSYRAHATLLVAPDETIADAGDALRALEALDRRSMMATLARLPASDLVRGAAEPRVGAAGLERYAVNGSVVPNTTVLRVEVEGPDADVAARYANAIAEVTRAEVKRAYRVYALRPLESARAGRRPVSPDRARSFAVAGAAGLGLGVLAAFLASPSRRPLAIAA